MNKTSVDLGNIPPIGSAQNPIKNDKKSVDMPILDNAPYDITLGSFFGKVVIGIVVGICVAALLFASLSAIGGITSTDDGNANSILNILLPVIGFIVGFVGNLALAGLYNIFFSKKYYDFGKMFGLIFTSSIILFVFFFLIYLLYTDMSSLYLILGLQIIFSLYITLNLIDFLSQPNYSASSLIGNTLGCVLSVVIYLGLKNSVNNIVIFVVIASIVAYAMTIFGASLWDAIYYKFYEWGNNPFYLPSLNELREERQKEELKKQQDEEEVNVEMK